MVHELEALAPSILYRRMGLSRGGDLKSRQDGANVWYCRIRSADIV